MLENICIESTTDYNRFKTLVGNRGVILGNVKKLVASMSNNQLASIAIVNSKDEIIDGQHRYEACRELGLPFYYITMPNYGIEEVHVLNSNMKNWTNEDYVRQFSDRFMHGEKIFKDYKVLVDFMDSENIQMSKALIILEDGKKSGSDALRDGTFKVIVDMGVAYQNLEELKDIESEIGTTLSTSIFWQCYVLAKQVSGFSHTDFARKLKRSRSDVEETKNKIEYMLSTFEAIYNDRSRNPISLAFDAMRIYKESKNDGK